MFNFWPFNISSKRREEAEKNEHARERMRTFMGQPSPLPEAKRRASKVIPIGHPEHPANKPRGPLLRELEPQRPAARSTGASLHHAAPYGGRSAPSTPAPADDIMSNPLHPLNPLNPVGVYSHAHYSAPAEPSRCDSSPSRSYDSSSSSSSCDSGSSSSSDSGSSYSSSDSF